MNNIVVQSDVLPMLPGYAIGNIIKKDAVNLVLWKKRCLALEEQIRQAQTEKAEAKKDERYTGATLQVQQSIISHADAKILKLMNDRKGASAEIAKLQEKEDFSMQETFPIDMTHSKLRTEYRSFFSEKLDHMILSKKDNVQEQLDKFSSQLFSQDNLSNYLSMNTLTQIASRINNLLLTEEQISLVGSFITLPQVRVMDPIHLRKNAILSSQLKAKAKEYYVLTEAVLGGVFIGFGRIISKMQEETPGGTKEETPKFMARLATINFISQGAIPKVSDHPENVNMWNVYVSWKERLQGGAYTGYPIGFKWKELQDILDENEVQ